MSMLTSRDDAIAGTWKKLRQGDELARVADTLPCNVRRALSAWQELGSLNPGLQMTSEARLGSQHANRWTWQGALKVAFGQIGGSGGQHTRTTHNELAAVSAVALANAAHTQQSLRTFREVLGLQPEHERPPWCIIERKWDLTPLTVSFGMCADLLRPVAKYWSIEQEPQDKGDVGRRGARKRTSG
jgi:hypothetical protein